jgi:hypothetical protein
MGMPGIGLLMDGAMQHAPHPGRQWVDRSVTTGLSHRRSFVSVRLLTSWALLIAGI